MTSEFKRLAQRASAAFGALGLGTAIAVTSLLSSTQASVGATGPTGLQVQNRAIYMSSATPNASGQTYLVTFKPGSTTSIKGIIVDFCSTSPLIGDTCTAPTAFSVGTPTVSFASATTAGGDPVNATGLPSASGSFTPTALNSGRTLELTNANGTGTLSTSTLYNFAITTVHNPSTTGTFYARIITYTSATGDIASYTDTTPGSTDALDYGGYALSTVANISVTAKVQESLTFCASATDLSASSNCAAATPPNITIGHGLPAPGIIDNTAVDASSAYTQISTNATSGAVVRMHATNSCANGGLSATGGGTCPIPGLGSLGTPLVPVAVTAGTSFFGLLVTNGTTTSGVASSSGTYNADANYNDGTNNNPATPTTDHFGMDTTTLTGVTSTYGDIIANTNTAPCSQMNNRLVFAATASLTVPAGIYTGSESLIATGTF